MAPVPDYRRCLGVRCVAVQVNLRGGAVDVD